LPHANNEAGKQGMEVPSDEPYGDKPWPQAQKNHAAMITRLDTLVGRVMQKLKDLKLDAHTIVLFSSDNGPHKEGGGDPTFFHSSGPLQGIKRSMHDGGIRVPMIVRYPGKVAAGSVSSQVWSFCDVLPTLAELAGAEPPQGIDGISVVPTLLGAKAAGREQPQHDYLYWEFSEGGFKQAARAGKWKAVHPLDEKLQLYDLSTDLAEQHDVAAQHPDVVARMAGYLTTAHVDSAEFPIKRGPLKPK
jgi:arylsulfatase A-like enzyme